jgi:hypothetical protein
MEDALNKVKDDILSGNLETAIQAFQELRWTYPKYEGEIISICRRYRGIQQAERQNTIDFNTLENQKNKVVADVLDVIRVIQLGTDTPDPMMGRASKKELLFDARHLEEFIAQQKSSNRYFLTLSLVLLATGIGMAIYGFIKTSDINSINIGWWLICLLVASTSSIPYTFRLRGQNAVSTYRILMAKVEDFSRRRREVSDDEIEKLNTLLWSFFEKKLITAKSFA